MKNRIISFLLIVTMLIGLLAMPASAADVATGNHVQVTIVALQYSSTFAAYDSERQADQHPINVQVDEDAFPVEVRIVGKNGDTKTYTYSTYGTKKLAVEDGSFIAEGLTFICTFGLALPFLALHKTERHATIIIEKPQTDSTVSTETDTSQESTALTLEERYDLLMREINFPMIYSDSSTYAKEIMAYLNDEWDGSDRTGNDWGGYLASRCVVGRTYYWTASNLHNGKSYSLSANVDYNGSKDIIEGSSTQSYSLAVDYANGDIEQWHFFEQLNAWRIDAVAKGDEKIDTVIPLANENGSKDSCQAFVSTIDTENQQHFYSLLPTGTVRKTM